jgi:2-alkenal reductase
VNAQIETAGPTYNNSGVGFAIPVNIVAKVIPDLIENNRFEWAWLGVQGGNITPTIVQKMGLSQDWGAYIMAVTPGSPAEEAGIQGGNVQTTNNGRPLFLGGDVIIAIDDQPVRTFEDLLIYFSLETEPNQEVAITILRNNKPQTINVRLEIRPEQLINRHIP